MVCIPLPDTIKDTRIFFFQKNKSKSQEDGHDNEVKHLKKKSKILIKWCGK